MERKHYIVSFGKARAKLLEDNRAYRRSIYLDRVTNKLFVRVMTWNNGKLECVKYVEIQDIEGKPYEYEEIEGGEVLPEDYEE